jgi:hypothetical protein
MLYDRAALYIILSIPQKSRIKGPLHPPHAVALLEGKWLIEKNIEPPVAG